MVVMAVIPVKMCQDDRVDFIRIDSPFSERQIRPLLLLSPAGRMAIPVHLPGVSAAGIHQNFPSSSLNQENQDRKFFLCLILFLICRKASAVIEQTSGLYRRDPVPFHMLHLLFPCALSG